MGAFSASMAPAASKALQAPAALMAAASAGVFRWVVERSLAWLHRFRRHALREERRADVHEAFLTLGCALITWRQLKREF